MKFGLVLSLDYEIFGNGEGSVKDHIIKPTNEILAICSKHNFKLTIMFEIGEYWAFKKAEKEGLLDYLDYSPANEIENQIKDLVSQGHDVQLHLHPQWLGSRHENKVWILNHNQWRLSDFPLESDRPETFSVIDILRKGKETLEEILQPVKSDYKCLAFRAGSWCLQPEKKIITAMKKLDFKIDSSSFDGGYNKGFPDYDYRDLPFKVGSWWTTEDSVCKEGEKGENILELPIFSIDKPFYHNLNFTKIKAILFSRLQSRGSKYVSVETNNSAKLGKFNIFRNYPFKLDFCKLTSKKMKAFINLAMQESVSESKNIIPIVAIGHSKNFTNANNLDNFLSIINNDYYGKIVPLTLQSFYHNYQ